MKVCRWILVRGATAVVLTLGIAQGIAQAQTAPDEIPAIAVEATPERARYSLLETIALSIFNKRAPKREWTPLYADTFFSEGWFEPHIGPPPGTGGSVRQGWIGVPEAFFNRQIVGIYSQKHGVNGGTNETIGGTILESPMNRRYDFGVLVPFADSISDKAGQQNTGVGDTLFFNRFLVHETADLSVSFNCNVLAPTGSRAYGNQRTSVIPYVAFYKDLQRGFSFRGAGGADVPVDDRPDGRTSSIFGSLAAGQTLTPHDTPIVGDFTYYLCANIVQDFGTGNNHNAQLSLTPGIRTHLGRNWFFLAGIAVPVTGLKQYDERYTFVLVKGF
ncbi:MAG: hypothetical protein U0744_08660 [Gemmataceae bacterium]